MSIVVERLSVTPVGATAPVLNDVSFLLQPGERALLLGPSGAGKSTLLLALSGVLNTLETAEISGSLAVTSSGLLLQNYSDATIADSVFRDVAFGAESAGIAAVGMGELVTYALEQVGLAGLDQARNPATLSGGELQRVCLAGLLTLKPAVLLLDEPTAQLDAESAAEVRAAVGEYLEHSGATALVAEHLFADWLPLMDRVLVLNASGQLVADGTPETVLDQHATDLQAWGLWLPELTQLPEQTAPSKLSGAGLLTALVGPSGAGKSTRLKAELAEIVGGAGWLPQNPALLLTQNSVLACLTQVTDAQSARDLLAQLGLNALVGANPHEISGGEQRRLALAIAVANKAHDPGPLFLDEPTAGLDRHSHALVLALIEAQVSKGRRVVAATHDPRLIALAHEVVQIEPVTPMVSPPSRPVALFSPLGLLVASFVTLIGALQFANLASAVVALLAESIGLAALSRWYPALRKPRLLVPILVGVASVGFSGWWLSQNHDAVAAALVAVRVAFFGLPGLLFAASVSPSALGDQLGQTLRLPARPVVAAMVGLNRIQLLQRTWEDLALSRRIHGTASSRVREIIALTTFTLLAATRSAESAAIAMEARGFSIPAEAGGYKKRTWAVPARWQRGDLALISASVCLVAVGVAWR